MTITNLQNLKEYLNQQSLPDIFFAVTFPKDAFGLEEIFPIKIVSFDHHPITNLLPQNSFFSLTANTKDYLKRRSTTILLRHPATNKYISFFNQPQPKILVYKPSASLEKICEKNHWQLLANLTPLNRQIENKINFSQIVSNINLPQPPHDIEKLSDISYFKYEKKFGPEFFLQFPRGFAGSSTFLINSSEQLQEIKNKYLNYPTKISQKITGPTYSLNACVVNSSANKQKIIIQPPFYQITNLPDLNTSPGGTCGNIYYKKLPIINNLSKLYSDTTKFSNYLYDQNYRGIFGLDFVIDETTGQHYFIECNPRLTASIPMVTKLQIKNQQVPLLALHIMEMLHLGYELSNDAIDQILSQPVVGAQIIFRNIKSDSSLPPIILDSGIYTTKQNYANIIELKNIIINQTNTIEYIRSGKDILDIKKDDEFLVLSEPKDHLISPNIEYLRVQCLKDN